MDGGIVIGVLVAIVDHVVHSSRTTGIFKVNKRSRAVWSPEEHKILQSQAYNLENPKIVTIGKPKRKRSQHLANADLSLTYTIFPILFE